MMTKPMAWLLAAPAPCDITSGIIPATNATVVIRIGRSRSRFACMIASARRVGPVKDGVRSTQFVAILEVDLGSGFWCNEVSWQVRPDDEAEATYGRKNTGRRRIVPRVRVGCGLIRIPEEGELS